MSDEPGLLTDLLPPAIAAADLEDHGGEIKLHEAERALIASAGDKRRRDFTLGRDCAHRALRRLGIGAGPILQRKNGAPLWPSGVVGSITHAHGYAAAAAAPATLFLGIGIDAERVEGLAENVERRLFVSEERAWLEGLAPDARKVAAILLFSAKEACFKAYALASLHFQEMRVTPEDRMFRVAAHGFEAQGRWALAGDLLVTAVAIGAN